MSNFVALTSLPLVQRVEALVALGKALGALSATEWASCLAKAAAENPWFSSDNMEHARARIQQLLRPQALQAWIANYELPSDRSYKVGLVLAGNIPGVGFHDLLCVLMSGHVAYIKPSRRDRVLLALITETLLRVCPAFAPFIYYPERLNKVEALIATGTHETAAHFARYFGHVPHILRGARSSAAILCGQESKEELQALAEDVFRYFGLGCRSVTKLYVPSGYSIEQLPQAWTAYEGLLDHARYANHYLYQRALCAAGGQPHIDGAFFLLKEEKALFSPIAMLFYEEYSTQKDLNMRLHAHRDPIQALYACKGVWPKAVPLGTAQAPTLNEYADNIDTMSFLSTLGTQ